jgi:hypothetical protein
VRSPVRHPLPGGPVCVAHMSRPRTCLSVGNEFLGPRKGSADVTTTRIGFFGSQPLVTANRLPSGYRKFCGNDVARLRPVERKRTQRLLAPEVGREVLTDGTSTANSLVGRRGNSSSALHWRLKPRAGWHSPDERLRGGSGDFRLGAN